MAFWSGERLDQELRHNNLVAPFKPKNLDCASYRLSVGEQVFATSDKFSANRPSDPIIQVLGPAPNHTLRIPPGQFAFLLTDEIVSVPPHAIALISMRAGYKLKGLINVSGFHVDPGWCGKLLFSVYNAGPTEVVVERGEAMFLIVYADLDRKSAKLYDGKSQNQDSIKPGLLEGMGSQVFSPLMLQRKVDDLTSRVESAERSMTLFKSLSIALGTVAGLLLALIAIFATYAPTTLGLIVGSVVQAGGYELKLKPAEAPTVQIEGNKPAGAETAIPAASAQSAPKNSSTSKNPASPEKK